MAYIGSPPASRVLSSADIAQGSVTLDDINFTDQPTNMDISGTIDNHTMRLADGVTVVGDVTLSDNLILSKISDDGNAITLTNDSSTRTITGTGSLEASTLTQTPNASLTGMTGTIGSGVTLNSDAVYPSGHVIQTMWGEHATETSITSTTKGSGTATGLTVTITPTSTSNKLLFNLGVAFYGTGGDGGIGGEIHDGSSVVATDANLTAFYINGDGTEYIRTRHFFMAFITPASTSSTTYSVRMFRDSAMTVNAQGSSEKSHITVQEVVQ